MNHQKISYLLSFIASMFLLFGGSQAFSAVDQKPCGNDEFANLEFSLDRQQILFTRTNANGDFELHHARLNASNAKPLLSDCNETPDTQMLGIIKLGMAAGYPQWGVNDGTIPNGFCDHLATGKGASYNYSGNYFVYVDIDGDFHVVLTSDTHAVCDTEITNACEVKAQFNGNWINVPRDCDATVRGYPYPSKDASASAMWVTYFESSVAGGFEAYLVDLSKGLDSTATLTHYRYTSEPFYVQYPTATVSKPAAFLAFPWPMPGESAFYYGVYPDCDLVTEVCDVQVGVMNVDPTGVNAPDAPAIAIDDWRGSKPSQLPFSHGSDRYIVSNKDLGNEALLYKQDKTTGAWAHEETIDLHDLTQSNFINVTLAQSHEFFVWKGDRYLVFQVDEKQLAPAASIDYPGEIWVAMLDEPGIPTCRVSTSTNGTTQVRFEAEPLVLLNDQTVFLYYNEGNPNADLPAEDFEWRLRRVKLQQKGDGLTSGFDYECKNGLVHLSS